MTVNEDVTNTITCTPQWLIGLYLSPGLVCPSDKIAGLARAFS